MIRLDGKETKCWQSIVKKYALPDTLGATLIDMAKSSSNRGTNQDPHLQVYSQFYILFTINGQQQEPHIDLFRPMNQYGMIVTPGESSTIIYDNASVDERYRISSLAGLANFFGEKEMYPKGFSPPSTELLDLISNLVIDETDPTSVPYQIDKLGLGSLFNIATPEFIEQIPTSMRPYFQSTSSYLANSKRGTTTSIPGGEAHAGYGSSKSDLRDFIVRLLIFWTGAPTGTIGYDGDSQDTKVTTTLDLAFRLWDDLKNKLREEMLWLVCLTLMMSFPIYKQFCHRNFSERPTVQDFICEVMEKPNDHEQIIARYALFDNFFKNINN
jgi:hypothetical protein